MNLFVRLKLLEDISFLLGSGLSQKEIANKLNITQQMVSYYRKVLKQNYFENEGCVDDKDI